MIMCKICKNVKFDFLFEKKYMCCNYGCIKERVNVCKKCSKNVCDDIRGKISEINIENLMNLINKKD